MTTQDTNITTRPGQRSALHRRILVLVSWTPLGLPISVGCVDNVQGDANPSGAPVYTSTSASPGNATTGEDSTSSTDPTTETAGSTSDSGSTASDESTTGTGGTGPERCIDTDECPRRCQDGDGDGYLDAECGGVDCDDGDPTINPGQEEECGNGEDDNCDGAVDDGCTCSDADSPEPCGASNTGECILGSRVCVGGLWGMCTGEVGPVGEICDGLDQDCDGTFDNGTFLPATLDAAEWIPAGWFDAPELAAVFWSDRLALYDVGSGIVSDVLSIAEAWEAVSAEGTPPPGSAIDSVAVLPAGIFAAEVDALWVTAGANLYWTSQGDVWHSDTIEAVVGTISSADALAVFPQTLLPGATEDVVVIASGGSVYTWTVATELTGPYDILDITCPPGSVGQCPTGISSITSTPTGVIILDGDSGYFSEFHDNGKGGWLFEWSPMDVSTVPCTHAG